MGRDVNPKKKGDAQKTTKFGKKTAPTTYEADGKRIKDFCERPENRNPENVLALAKRVCETLGFTDKSLAAVDGYIRRNGLGPASGKAAGNKPKESANDLLATHPTEDAAMDIS